MDAPTVMVSSRSGRAAASALMANSSARMNVAQPCQERAGKPQVMQTDTGGDPRAAPLVSPRLLGSGGSVCSVSDQHKVSGVTL